MTSAALCTPLKADLLNLPGQNDQQIISILGNLSIGDTSIEIWRFDGASMDNTSTGSNPPIRPNDFLVTDPGRWVFVYKFQPLIRQERYTGTTNASGVYAVTFATPFPTGVIPNVQPTIIAGTNKETIVTNVTNTGFTLLVQGRNDVIGVLPTYSNVSGRTVQVLVTQP